MTEAVLPVTMNGLTEFFINSLELPHSNGSTQIKYPSDDTDFTKVDPSRTFVKQIRRLIVKVCPSSFIFFFLVFIGIIVVPILF